MRRLFPKLFTVLMAACFTVALAGCENGHGHVHESGKCCGNAGSPNCCKEKASSKCPAGCKCDKCMA